MTAKKSNSEAILNHQKIIVREIRECEFAVQFFSCGIKECESHFYEQKGHGNLGMQVKLRTIEL